MNKSFVHEREFDSIEKLTKYLKRIEKLKEAYMERSDNSNWLLSFNIED